MKKKYETYGFIQKSGRTWFGYVIASRLLLSLLLFICFYEILVIVSVLNPLTTYARNMYLFVALHVFPLSLLFFTFTDYSTVVVRSVDHKGLLETMLYIRNQSDAASVEKRDIIDSQFTYLRKLDEPTIKPRLFAKKAVITVGICAVLLFVAALSLSFAVMDKPSLFPLTKDVKTVIDYKNKIIDTLQESSMTDQEKQDAVNQYEKLTKDFKEGGFDYKEYQDAMNKLLDTMKKEDGKDKSQSSSGDQNQNEKQQQGEKGQSGKQGGQTQAQNLKDFLKSQFDKPVDSDVAPTGSKGFEGNKDQMYDNTSLNDFKTTLETIFTGGQNKDLVSSHEYTDEEKTAMYSLFMTDFLFSTPVSNYSDPLLLKLIQTWKDLLNASNP